MITIREANETDLSSILKIYNQGIEDRIATLESEQKDIDFMNNWFSQHNGRYKVLVAVNENRIIGWASLNRYSNRRAYAGVAELSIYIDRENRGKGVGQKLLRDIEEVARDQDFHKIILFTFLLNKLGQSLYMKSGFRKVGIFEKQGLLDGQFIDVMAMEKIISKST
ncbi:arsinothricin resistance N-acetyltransferase ArsN1 family A [Metabacillus malikii]|uniref:Phosphinothricin acetyltransferase n=1 Tax=Metabacillus malikii TaxID=1504265 RepID=A0ABT9ZHQ2_9BACI|nr:arsinothricin resistance N-acetyltransferase ArsN1 family A [Metabacillus malikii]MDQ0231822.1 phosphinothricin acetyltransferase [Metabacillus malikii]